MIKRITKIGNSQGILLDATTMNMAHLKVGDKVNMEIHEGGAISLTPIHPVISPERAAKSARKLVKRNSELFKRLA